MGIELDITDSPIDLSVVSQPVSVEFAEAGPQGPAGPSGSTDLDKLLFLTENGAFEGQPASYREITGQPFPTLIVWWTDSGKTQKIVDKAIAYNANKTPATITRHLYASDGVTINLTAVDSIVYSGVFEQHRSRVVS